MANHNIDYQQLTRFDNKRIVISGGNGLLGLEMAKAFQSFGGDVVIADLKHETTHDMEFWQLDIGNVGQLANEITLFDNDKKVDIWVNCAYPRTSDWALSLEEIDATSWQKNIDMHLNGYCIAANTIAKQMAQRQQGVILNVCSIQALVAPDFSLYEGTEMTSPAAYMAIKGGILAYTKYLASYYGNRGLRVNAISPGGIFANQPQSFIDKYAAKTIIGRLAKPHEIATGATFLCSDAATYITGFNLIIDGGLTTL